jgi:biopolymer transport protein ExbB/TolQ
MDAISISPIAMFQHAGLVGKCVMGLLGLASVWCWLLILEGLVSTFRLRAAIGRAASGARDKFIDPIRAAGFDAARMMIPGESVGERRQRVVEAMNRRGRDLLTRFEGGLPNLAIISSVAPFVGLFGTVWGIMTSFAGIAEAKDTSLAVVAPGIAEALAATAYGLAAAIPASFGYNRIGASLSRSGQALSSLIEHEAVGIAANVAHEDRA